MCTVLLPPGVNSISVNKYIDLINNECPYRNLELAPPEYKSNIYCYACINQYSAVNRKATRF